MFLYFRKMLLLFTSMSIVRYLYPSESLIYPVNIGYLIILAFHSNEIQAEQKIELFFFIWYKHIMNINIIYINRIFRIIQNLLLDFIFFQITSTHFTCLLFSFKADCFYQIYSLMFTHTPKIIIQLFPLTATIASSL